jgi:2-hydroxycyclohexanecarboxyl-CoA dehydrogenase
MLILCVLKGSPYQRRKLNQMPGRLKGKVALITGAGGSGGIGAVTAQLFCAEGAKVVIVDLSADGLERTAHEIRSVIPDAELLPIAADVSQEQEVVRVVAQARARFDGLTTLVNNAGVREYTRIAECSEESWHRIINVNLLGTAFCCKIALPELRRASGAAIVNVSSVNAIAGRPGMGQYDATKAAISALTRTLAVEEVSHGIRVNAVCPGGTLTGYHIARYREKGVGIDELRQERAPRNPMQRWANPVEIAYPILWLASDEASFITGIDLLVDGGISI